MSGEHKNVLVMTRDQQHYSLRFNNEASAANAVSLLRRQPDIVFAYRVKEYADVPDDLHIETEKFVSVMLELL